MFPRANGFRVVLITLLVCGAGLALLGWSYVRVERAAATRTGASPGLASDLVRLRDAQVSKARGLLDAGQFAAAVAALDRALAAAPGDAETLALQVRALRAQRHYTAARSTARRILDTFPQSPLAHILLGSIAMREGDAATARQDLGRAVALDTSSSLALAQLASLDLMEGKTGDARRRAKQALALNPEDATSLRVLTRVSRSVPELLSVYSSLRDLNPSDLLTRSWIELLRGNTAPEVNYVSPVKADVIVPCEAGADGRLYVRARVGPFTRVRLLLDTGGSGLTLSESLARRMGMRLREFSESAGVGGLTRHSHPILVDRIDVGGMRARAVMATASNLPAGMDGILNPMIFAPPDSGVSLELRPLRHELVFLAGGTNRGLRGASDQGWVTLPYLADSHHVIFGFMLAGRPATALLDTGAGVEMLDRSVLERLPGVGLQPAVAGDGSGDTLLGFGGTVEGVSIVRDVTLRIAGNERVVPRLFVLDLNAEAFRFQVDLDAVVGIQLLSSFDLRIDPRAGLLRLRIAS